MANKNSFVFYTEWLEQLKLIASCGTAEDMATLCDGIKALVEDGETTEMTPLAQAIFNPMRNQIDRDREKWEKSAKQKSESGKKGANARWQSMANDGTAIADDSDHMAKMAVDVDVDVDVNVDVNGDGDVDADVSPDGDNTLSSTALAVDTLPAPQFVAEADPKKLTDRMLEEEFNALWLLYPRKDGKKKALAYYKKARRKGTTFEAVETGINNYNEHLRQEGTEPQYIAMGSTWFYGNRWEDDYHIRHGPKPGSIEWLMTEVR